MVCIFNWAENTHTRQYHCFSSQNRWQSQILDHDIIVLTLVAQLIEKG